MKAFFVYRVTDNPFGGVNSFNRALRKTFTLHPEWGIEVVDDIYRAEIVFLSAASRGPNYKGHDQFVRPWNLRNLLQQRHWLHPLGLVNFMSAGSLPLVHRLDGLTARYGRRDGQPYDELQQRLNRKASATIFQSDFCRQSFRDGLTRQTDHVIANGVDGSLFPWAERHAPTGPLRLAAMSWSSNPAKGHAICAELSRLPHVEMTFVGRWPEQLDKANVKLIPALPQHELAGFLHQAHAFIHAAENDPAPNVVTEALATGLPVLYRSSGGTPEIVQSDRYGIAFSEFHSHALWQTLETLRGQYESFISTIAASRRTFLMETTGRLYAQVFKEAR